MSKARVSAEQVKEIIPTTIEDSVILASMIDTANIYVDTHLSGAGHSKAILEKIELYLASHFVALTDERGALMASKMGDARDEWETSILSSGLGSTRFGQAAITLDSTGILAGVGTARLKAEFRVV